MRAGERLSLRVGATDDLSYVPASGYVANLVGFFSSVLLRRNGAPHDMEAFLRVAGYTAHAYREGVAVMAGISAAWSWRAH